MDNINQSFDSVAQEYKSNKCLPYRLIIEEYTLFKVLGALDGRKVLELACGEGHYTRKMKNENASEVVGVDISRSMIQLAEAEEKENPLGVSYICCDVGTLGVIGEFHLVVGVYFLCQSDSYSQLLQFAKKAFNNLRSGGRFVGIDFLNFDSPPDTFTRYGFMYDVQENFEDGSIGTKTFFNTGGSSFKVQVHCWREKTYEMALLEAGFSSVEFKGPWVDESRNPYPMDYWSDFLRCKGLVATEAIKD